MSRVFVTGAAGYIGSTLVPRLLEAGHQVTVLDDFRYSTTTLLACTRHERFEVVRGDVRDEDTVRRLVARADVIAPLAAIVGAPACEQSKFDAISINRDAVLLLNRLRSKSQRLLFPTTNSGYGQTDGATPMTEELPLNPISVYGRTKMEAEATVLESENVATFRLATVFGVSPRLRLDLLVNDFAYQAYRTGTLVLYEGHFTRNYVAVQDVADLFAWAIDRKNDLPDGAYNFGLSDANLTKRQLCELIAQELPRFQWFEASVGQDPDQRNYLVSNDKIERAGFAARTSVRQGVRELLKAFNMIIPESYRNA